MMGNLTGARRKDQVDCLLLEEKVLAGWSEKRSGHHEEKVKNVEISRKLLWYRPGSACLITGL
jgi:hypothetical protein